MSKKMLKRSLALGALMAFVITGSAMAGEKVFAPDVNINQSGANLEYESIGYGGTVSAGETGTITTGGISSYRNLSFEAKDITVTRDGGTGVQTALDSKGQTLDIDFFNKFDVNVTGDGHGIVANAPNATIDIDGNGTGSLKVIAAENAVSLSRRDDYVNSSGVLVHHVENNKINIHDVVDVYIESKGEDEDANDADRGHAIYAHNENGKITIDASGILTVKTIAGKNAVYANGNGSEITVDATTTNITGTVRADKSTVISVGGDTITIDANGGRGVNAVTSYYAPGAYSVINLGDEDTTTINIKNASYGILSQYNGAKIDIKADQLNISDTKYGIWAMNASYTNHPDGTDDGNLEDDSRIVIGKNTDTKIIAESVAIIAQSGGNVKIDGNLYAEGPDGVIDVRGEAVLNINEGNDKNKVVQLVGDIIYDYTDHIVDSTVNINLANENSYFTGNVLNTAPEESGEDGVVTRMALGLSDGATWTTDDTSFVNDLSLNGGVINVVDGGEGAVIADKVTGSGGTINVDNATANQFVIGEKGDSETETAPVITVATTNKELALSDLVGVVADETGDNAADFVEKTDGDVYSSEKAAVNEKGELGETVKVVDSANVSVNDMVAIGMMSWRAEMNDMNKRMGELRNANGEHGVWVRMVRGESEFNSVKNQYNQYQLGYDEKLSVDKRWTVGAALSYTDAENNFAEGTGESTNKALSIYGSKLNDDGTFVDLIAKYARLDNDFKTLQGQGAAEYDTNAYSFSAEVGKRIQQGKGLWIEPQVELTYGKVSAVDYVTDKGVNVAQDGMESLVGRIGFSLGKDIEKGNVYARASYLYDFDGETKATLNNDAVLTNDLGGGWWEVGVGANINLSKATYIYADVEKTFGGEVDTNWQWNLGVRYSF